ncbi:MAG: hypothetical protein LBK60_00675 [Verrucomicrobiales bacterium]|jgi:transposase-like protein|nr:hypothetical protein [Verrucomicrobiales bacterium]
MACPHGHTVRVVKNGQSQHGWQRFLCRECQSTFGADKPRRPPPALKEQTIALYLEGVGFRAIGRLLGISNVTPVKWVRLRTRQLILASVKPQEVTHLQCAEVCTYLAKKRLSLALVGSCSYYPTRLRLGVGPS